MLLPSALSKMYSIKSFKMKLLVSFFLIICLFIITQYFSINRISQDMITQAVKFEEKDVLQLKENLSNYLGTYIDLTNDVYYDERISQALVRQYSNRGASTEVYFSLLGPTFSRYRNLKPEIETITIYTNNDSIMTNGDEIAYIEPDSTESKVYNEIKEANGKVVWSLYKEKNDEKLIVLNRILLYGNKEVGMLTVGIRQKFINLYIKEQVEGSDVYIIGPGGIIMGSTCIDTVGKNLRDTEFEGLKFELPVSVNELDINGEQKKVISTKLHLGNDSPFEWQIIKTVPIKRILREMNNTKKYQSFIIIFVALFAVILAIILSQNLSKRIKYLVKSMEKLQEGDFSTLVDFPQNDEIGNLGKSFNTMATKLNQLVNEVYNMKMKQMEMEINKRETELYALQSQINPHFLFNTLEAIQWGIQENNKNTSQIVKLLAKSFRRSVKWDEDMITLEDEIGFAREYLIIQKFRLQEKLDWTIEIPDAALNYKIPKLTIQPLIENSIYHGISMKKGKGIIRMMVKLENEKLCIRIEDDGMGIATSKLEDIYQSLDIKSLRTSGNHIGLKNVNERLKLQYGSEYSIKIVSELGMGTCIDIQLPI